MNGPKVWCARLQGSTVKHEKRDTAIQWALEAVDADGEVVVAVWREHDDGTPASSAKRLRVRAKKVITFEVVDEPVAVA